MADEKEDAVIIVLRKSDALAIAEILKGVAGKENLSLHVEREADCHLYPPTRTEIKLISSDRSKLAKKGDMVITTNFVIPVSENKTPGDIRDLSHRINLVARVFQ
jgi:hypothetical protein